MVNVSSHSGVNSSALPSHSSHSASSDNKPLQVKHVHQFAELQGSPVVPAMEKVDPAIRSQQDKTTAELAQKQSTDARALLRQPNAIAKRQLTQASKSLLALINHLSDEGKAHFFARAMRGVLKEVGIEKGLVGIDRLAHQSDLSTADDHNLVISLCGDIGALISDSLGSASPLPPAEKDIIDKTNQQFPLMQPALEKSKQIAGSQKIGPYKKQEREGVKDGQPRVGIHNTGKATDLKAGKSGLGFGHRDYLSPVYPMKAMINKNRVDATQEPLVGHISGSLNEIVTTMLVLNGGNLSEDIARTEDQMARIALANGFLVGNGLHSAVETLEASLNLSNSDVFKQGQGRNADFFLEARQGFSQSRDMAVIAHAGAATNLISESMRHYTSAPTSKF
ncbi:hypothetical protein [Vibrio lentus]|uniref:Uncharacterized protein n=1 Tax=Vibrio lentus TaxID=136468 RepID=A0A855IWB3_9VIBR|nr:hypothetical protein [Vibrio lentus]PMJ65141.1 hypothetical protein BCU18_15460 [Vibrio lentus]PMJ81455.1 hypothetical protein BCU14_17950 [Vibrio lentus]PMM56493.1 hypothetical protein BCT51_06880 [Vibrio lentus]PMM62882.1 hypothetical protein BCT50_00085 [Vibrio lentus]PMN38386.1 hypothetical protein BCT33_01800 [Vibrio lentus]